MIKKSDFLNLILAKCLIGDMLYISGSIEISSPDWLDRIYYTRQFLSKLNKKYKYSQYYKEIIKLCEVVVSYDTYTNQEYIEMFTKIYNLMVEWILLLNGKGAMNE